MKRILIVLIVSVLACSPAFSAIFIDSLSPEAKLDYLSNSLSIQTEKNAKFSSFGYSNANAYATSYGATAYGTSSSFGTGTETTVWYPYLGASRIPVSDFYNMVGQEVLASQTLDVEAHNKKMQTVGYSLLGVGAVACIAGLVWGLSDMDSEQFLSPGMWVAIGGAALVDAGTICLFIKKDLPDVSISFAIGLSDIYNQQLFDSLVK